MSRGMGCLTRADSLNSLRRRGMIFTAADG